MLDTLRPIDTPEGVQLRIGPAGPVPRAMAFGIDLLIRTITLIIVSMIFGSFGEFGTGLMLLMMFSLEWLYPVLFEVFNHGATPGKRAFRIRVVHDNGVPVGWSGSVVRNLLRFVDFLPIAYGFGLVSMLCTDDFKRLGDLTAGTVVVYDDPPPRPINAIDVAPAPPPWSVGSEEQVALVAFAERSASLNTARAAELAALLEPVGVPDQEHLQCYAAWVQGER